MAHMENKPLISVVIPTFNRPTLLVRAIQSVVDQDYKNVEIIVVDDASEVDVKPYLEGFDLTLLKNDCNSGPCASRNKGLRESNGTYINFLDDDDILLPAKLNKQVQLFERSVDPKLGVITCDLLDERSGDSVKILNHVKGDIYDKLLKKYCVSGTETLLFKTEYVNNIGGFDEELESSQEYDLLIRFSEFYNIDYIGEVLTKKFRSEDQIHLNFDKKIQGAKHLYAKHNDRFKEVGIGFWLMKKLKLQLLLFRFYVGKIFGEKMYRKLLRE